jgi:hypothetical protein
MEILSATEKRTGRTGLIFSNEGRWLGQNILNVTIARLGHPCVGHGFRSTFRDWCGDHGVQREIAEAAFGHVVPGVEGDLPAPGCVDAAAAVDAEMADFVDPALAGRRQRHPDRSSVIPLHRSRVYCDKTYILTIY